MLVVAWLLAGLGVVLAVAAVRQPVCREQELRVALTARAMANGGAWLAPTYRGAPRYQKPPLMYWLTALGYQALGSSKSALVARLPGIAFALALIGLIYGGGRTLVGRRGAALGAAFGAASYVVLRFGFRAEGDIAQSFWMTAAIMTAWEALRVRRGATGRWVGAGLAAAAGVLTKSPAAAVILLLTVGGAAALRAPLRRSARGLGLAVLVLVVAVLPWYAVSLLGSARAMASDAVSNELSALLHRPTHPGPWFYYLYALPLALAPWSLVLPPAVVWLARRVRGRARESVLAAWFGATLLLLSCLGNKQIHYTTLLMPPAALVMGAWTARLRTARSARALTLYGHGVGLFLIAVGVAGATLGPVLQIVDWPWAVVLGIALAVAGGVAWHQAERWPHVPAPAALVGIALAALSLSGPWAPWVEDEHVIVPFARHLTDRLPVSTAVWVVGDDDGTLEFHLGRVVQEAVSFEWAWNHGRSNDVVIIAATDHQIQFPSAPLPAYEVRHRLDRVAVYARPPLSSSLQ